MVEQTFDKYAARGGALNKKEPIEAGRKPTEELVSIAERARSQGSLVQFTGLETRSISELIRIAAAGGRWQGRIDRHSAG